MEVILNFGFTLRDSEGEHPKIPLGLQHNESKGTQPRTHVSPDADLSTFTPWTQAAKRLGFSSPQICRRPLDCRRP